MFFSLILALALAAGPADPVDLAQQSFAQVSNYQVTLRSSPGDQAEIIRYFYKKPGYIRMEFTRPHKGALLLYDPLKNRAKLWPFGLAIPISLILKPDSPLLKSSRGHLILDSDIGAMLVRVKTLQQHGRASILGEATVGGRPTWIVNVESSDGFALKGQNRYLLWLDKDSHLPLKADGFGQDGKLMEEVLMDDLELNQPMDQSIFNF